MNINILIIFRILAIGSAIVCIGAIQSALFPMEIGRYMLFLEPMLILALVCIQKNLYGYGMIIGASYGFLLLSYSSLPSFSVIALIGVCGMQLVVQELLIRNQSILASALRINAAVTIFTILLHVIFPLLNDGRVSGLHILLSIVLNSLLIMAFLWMTRGFLVSSNHLFYEQ